MNKYKFLLSIILKETKITPQELNEIIKKHNLDEHLEKTTNDVGIEYANQYFEEKGPTLVKRKRQK